MGLRLRLLRWMDKWFEEEARMGGGDGECNKMTDNHGDLLFCCVNRYQHAMRWLGYGVDGLGWVGVADTAW